MADTALGPGLRQLLLSHRLLAIRYPGVQPASRANIPLNPRILPLQQHLRTYGHRRAPSTFPQLPPPPSLHPTQLS